MQPEGQMIRLLIRKELSEIIGSPKFSLTFGVCAVLILLAFFIGAKNYQTSLAQYEAAKAQNLRQLEGLADWYSVRDFRVYLPPRPLAALVSGIANDIGRTTEVHGRGDLQPYDSRYANEPMYAVFRFLDLEFVFSFILSLFAIVFAYDAVSGEKERGTLRLTFANPVPRGNFILGKLVGSYLGLTLPLLIPLALGCLLLPLFGVHLLADEWIRLVLVILVGLLYVGVFLAISICVSTLTHKSSSAFLGLLALWIAVVVIIPRSAVLLSARTIEVPSLAEIQFKKGRLASQLWREDRDKMSAFKPTSSSDPEKMGQEFQQFMQELSDKRDAKLKQLNDRLFEERGNAQSEQQRLALSLARVSPASIFSLAAAQIAGTSMSLQDQHKAALLAYQQEYGKFMFEKTGVNMGGGMMLFINRTNNGQEEAKKEINPHEMPAFTFAPPQVTETLGEASIDIGLLGLFNMMAFAAAFVAFRRYDMR
jgi:ABC-type transport system involved in multi-copper enzyme maturation permease subunit